MTRNTYVGTADLNARQRRQQQRKKKLAAAAAAVVPPPPPPPPVVPIGIPGLAAHIHSSGVTGLRMRAREQAMRNAARARARSGISPRANTRAKYQAARTAPSIHSTWAASSVRSSPRAASSVRSSPRVASSVRSSPRAASSARPSSRAASSVRSSSRAASSPRAASSSRASSASRASSPSYAASNRTISLSEFNRSPSRSARSLSNSSQTQRAKTAKEVMAEIKLRNALLKLNLETTLKNAYPGAQIGNTVNASDFVHRGSPARTRSSSSKKSSPKSSNKASLKSSKKSSRSSVKSYRSLSASSIKSSPKSSKSSRARSASSIKSSKSSKKSSPKSFKSSSSSKKSSPKAAPALSLAEALRQRREKMMKSRIASPLSSPKAAAAAREGIKMREAREEADRRYEELMKRRKAAENAKTPAEKLAEIAAFNKAKAERNAAFEERRKHLRPPSSNSSISSISS